MRLRHAWATGLVLLMPAATPAMVTPSPSGMREYVHARLADSEGQPEAAALQYARLLESYPEDKLLALRSYRQALIAGRFDTALVAAHRLDQLKALPADATLMLLAEAVTNRNWTAANKVIERIQREQVFGFLVPVMRGWVAFGQRAHDPARPMAGSVNSQLAGAYARDHGLLIRLAADDRTALAEIARLAATRDSRAVRLQLAAAALLAKRDRIAEARAMLDGMAPELATARALIDAGKPLPGVVDTPALGLSEMFAQLAVDVKGDGRSPVSLQLARLATYLAPDNQAAVIAAADLLASNGYRQSALKLLDRVSAESPLADAARQERASILLAIGDRKVALEDARRAAARPDADAADLVELGGILSDMDRPAEAATAYQRAIELEAAKGRRNWVHLFLKAGALDKAGDWPGAKKLLHDANRLAPGQAIILNYIGYGMLDRGEDLAEAQSYIERASALDPNDAAIADSLGWLYYQRGNYSGAIAALERAVVGEPGQSVINEHLGDAYWAVGRRIEARHAWQAALVQADPPSAERIRRKIEDGPDGSRAATAR